MEKFDVVVIGSGPGGYPAAIRAAQLGASVAIVEKEQIGGTCLNWGCIPTKTLIASSDLYARMRRSSDLGLSAGGAVFDYAAMAERKSDVVGKLQGGVQQLLKANGVTIIQGTACFTSRNRLAVASEQGPETLEAGSVILATGSTSAMPSFLPESDRVVESRQFLDRTNIPKRILVLGGGVIGCEFACMAAQLDIEVTIVEMLDDILLILDPDVRRELRRHMEKELGIEILTGAALQDVLVHDKGVTGTAGDKTVEADLLLVSVGRMPVTEGLDLDKAGLETNDKGFIEVDEFMRTKAASIYAVGDVTAGSTQLAHAATAQGITAAENACGKRHAADKLVPACIFTAPEIGAVGLTETEAKKQGRNIVIGKYMLAGLGKALAAGEGHGFVKLVVDAETDQVLGAQTVGAHATELISEATTAIRAELTAKELGNTIHCHPTFSEAWMEAAHAVHGTCIHQPPRRR